MKYLILALLLFCAFGTLQAQNHKVVVPMGISLPRDTTVRKQLLSDLNGFLSQKEKPNNENTFVLKSNLLETSILLDEMKEIEKSTKMKSDTFFIPYLVNFVRLSDSIFKLQIAYMGTNGNLPMLRAQFSILALKKGNTFTFNSPLKLNTAFWKYKDYNNTRLYYKSKIKDKKAKACMNLTYEFDKKLGATMLKTNFYVCDNFQEGLQLIGVDYKSDFNGRISGSLSTKENETNLVMNCSLTPEFSAYDPHDLWHNRLHNVVSTTIINKPVDEGTAYLYGGSWGVSWKEILSRFKTFANANPNADWFTLYNESKNFDEKAKYPLNVDMMINALIIKKLEKEKGFPAVITLMSCGKQEKGNENYFSALEKATGITKANFNEQVALLIKTN